MKQVIRNYTFNPSTLQVVFIDYSSVAAERVALITDITTGKILYNFADATVATITASGNVLTLSKLQGGEQSTDLLRIDYNTLGYADALYDTTPLPNNVFRDPMNTISTANWNFNTAASDLVYLGGNTASASWVGIVKSALVADTYTEMTSTNLWRYSVPMQASAGLSISQRLAAQQFGFDLVGVDNSGNVINGSSTADTAISGTVTVTTNVAVVNTTTNHNLLPGDIICFYGCAYSGLNLGMTPVTSIPSATQFTVASVLANGTYSATGGFVRLVPYDNYASYIIGHHFSGVTSGNNDTISKSGDRWPEISNWNPGNTNDTAAIPSENGINYSGINYSFPQRNRSEYILRLAPKFAQYMLKDADSTGSARSVQKRTQNFPDHNRQYKMRFRARNLPNFVVPVGYITAASKSGTTTATLTIPNHGLTVNDFVQVYGIRDQVNFANLTTTTVVSSVIDANTITVVFGLAATATSYGGFVYRVNAITAVPTTTTSAVINYAKTTDGQRLSLVYLASQGTLTPGEVWTLYGLVNSSNQAQTALHGRYTVAFTNTATFTVELIPLDGQNLTGVSTGLTNAGGSLIRNTELRIHFVRCEQDSPALVEVVGGQGDNDNSHGVLVNLNSQAVNALVQGTTWSRQVTQGSLATASVTPAAVIANTDKASAAVTTTSNSGTIAYDHGAAISALINVTAVSGTTPTLDVQLQESFDNGTTWQDVYHLPRITAVSTVAMPLLNIAGRRRWNYVVSGTTPSFTFSIVTMNASIPGIYLKNFMDRVIAPNTLSSNTTAYYCEGCNVFEIVADMGAITTTAPVFGLQFSDNNSTWRDSGIILNTAASAVTSETISGPFPKYARGVVLSAGSGATLNYFGIKAAMAATAPTIPTRLSLGDAATPFQLISAATTNATSLKPSPGVVYGIQAYNSTATAAYVKLYNKATAPTVGTDTPVKTVEVPANSGTTIPFPVNGIGFNAGIAFAITGLPTVADTTAVTLSAIMLNVDYA